MKSKLRDKAKILLIVLTVCGLLSSMCAGILRYFVEAANMNIELVADYAEIEEFSQKYGYDIGWFLRELKEAGIRSVALKEETLSGFSSEGSISLLSAEDTARGPYRELLPAHIPTGAVSIVTEDFSLWRNIREVLKAKVGDSRVSSYVEESNAISPLLTITVSVKEKRLLEDVGLGFSREKISMLKEAGLAAVLRPKNDFFVNEESIKVVFGNIRELKNVSAVVFDEGEVMGYPDFIGETEKQVEAAFLKVGIIEFTAQKGIERFRKNVLAIHSIRAGEIKHMDYAIARFRRAVVERGVRMLYIHLVDIKDRGLSPSSYVNSITQSLKKRGYSPGIAQPLPVSFPWVRALTMISSSGIVAAFLLMASCFRSIPADKIVICVLMSAVVSFCFAGSALFAQVLSLAAAVFFPVFAVTSIFGHEGDRNHFSSNDTGRLFFKISLFSLAAGLFITGLISRPDFMLRLASFRGIKIALVLPLAVSFFLFYGRDRKMLGRLWSRQVSFGDFMIILSACAGIYLFLARSGNNPSHPLSGMEYGIRDLMEKFLIVRPRFKEFLFGHPLMIAGIYLYCNRLRNNMCRILVTAGMAGQVSVINTFCHAHAPLFVSLVRTVNGFFIGAVFGAILIVFIKKAVRWQERS